MAAPLAAAPAVPTLEAWVREDAQRVADGTLSPRCAAFFWPSTRGDSRGVVLMLHGYSAGPWQFHSIAQRLNTAGLDVFCAPVAGHGVLRDGRLSAETLPGAGETQRYFEDAERMAQAALAHADRARLPLHVYGLSLGGSLAIQVARDHADKVQRLVVVAPILEPIKRAASLYYQAGRLLSTTRLGRGLLNGGVTGWGALPPAPWWPGQWKFSFGNLFASLDLGQRVLRDARPLPMATQVVLSDFDETCDPAGTRAFFGSVAKNCAIMSFGAEAQVIHPMVSAVENMDRGSRELLDAATTRFLAEGAQDRSTHAAPPSKIDLHPEQPLRRALAGKDTPLGTK